MTANNDPQALDPDIRDAVEGFERFRREFERDRAFFESLAVAQQKPRLLWIGCSDSRVMPSQITQADPGELFEIRNIANCVPPSWAGDDAVGAAIEYAVGHLGIDDIVVCGHTGCGGIQALSEPIPPQKNAHLGRWIEYTRPAHRLIAAAGLPESERLLATVRAHIHFQLDNLMTYEAVAVGVREGRIGIHGWLYDMTEGEIQAYDGATGAWRGLLQMSGR